MADNKLYDIHHGDDVKSPDTQTMRNEPQRTELQELPPSYQLPPNQYCPLSPPAGSHGYQQFDNQPMTSSTVVVVPQDTIAVPKDSVQTYVVLAALSNLCCCAIFGIIAMFYAGKADAHCDNNNLEGATRNLSSAKKWTLASFLTGLGIIIVSVVLFVILVFVAKSSTPDSEYNNQY